MSIFFDLYKFKIKSVLGGFRVSRANLILVALYLLSTLGGTIGISMAVVDSVRGGTDLTVHIDAFSVVINGFLALILVSTFRGIVVFEYEQGFIFTSSLTPRLYLMANLLTDLTVFSIFFCPALVPLAIISMSLTLSAMTILSLIALLIVFAFFLIFVKSSFSILQSVSKGPFARIAAIFFIFWLLLPAVGLVVPLPLRASELPYPSTLFAHAVLLALHGRIPPAHSFLAMACYFLVSFVLFMLCSAKNIFQFAKPVPLVSPFDTSMRMQTVKMYKNIRFFSRVGMGITLDLGSESLLRFLMRKEFIRMIRDGSLFTVLLFYLIVSIMSVGSRIGEVPFPVWLFVLGIYSFIVPTMLISNWRVSELDNLWIPFSSAVDLGCVVKPLLYDLTLTAFVVPAATILVLAFVSQIDPLIPLVLIASVSLIGCSTSLFAMVHFLGKRRRAVPSFMIGWVSMLLSSLLASPTYAYATLSLLWRLRIEINLLLAVPIIAYSGLVFWFFSKKVQEKAANIEI